MATPREYCVFIVAAFLALVTPVFAAVELDDFLGKSQKDVSKVFGLPDRQVANGPSETWYYGQSFFIFQQGKVSVWSDAGNLQSRLSVRRPAVSNTTDQKLRREWKNPWTKKETPTPDKVIDGLLK